VATSRLGSRALLLPPAEFPFDGVATGKDGAEAVQLVGRTQSSCDPALSYSLRLLTARFASPPEGCSAASMRQDDTRQRDSVENA
jgi:hypothetical protein